MFAEKLKLKDCQNSLALTGSCVSAQVAPVAPPRLLIFADKSAAIETQFDLRPTDAGANVAFLTQFGDVVYERTSKKNGLTSVALNQVVADLLTSPAAVKRRRGIDGLLQANEDGEPDLQDVVDAVCCWAWRISLRASGREHA